MGNQLVETARKAIKRCGGSFIKQSLLHHPVNRITNLSRIALASLKSQWPACPSFLPPTIILEVTNRCNLKCSTCVLGTDRAYHNWEKRDFTLAEFKDLVAQLPEVVHVWLQGVGEPLLNPELPEMIGYATSRGISSSFNTNGLLLTEERSLALLESGLHEMFVSINTTDPEAFSKTKSGASLDKIVDRCKNFIELKNRYGYRTLVGIRVILMRDTVDKARDMVELAASMGVDSIGFQGYLTGFGEEEENGQKLGEGVFEETLKDLKAFGASRNVLVVVDKTGDGTGGCTQPWLSPFITAEGYVQPCCSVFEPHRLNYGNIHSRSFRDIWLSREYVDFRSRFRERRHRICLECPLY